MAATARAEEPEWNWLSIQLMKSTFPIWGAAKDKGHTTLGTVFVLGIPMTSPAKSNDEATERGYFVLITAAHVLGNIDSDQATLGLRRHKDDGSWERLQFPLAMRKHHVPLWTAHPTADVAAMYVALPASTGIALRDVSLLVTDERMMEIDLHPGDEVLSLGFPYALAANDFFFPILRSGRVASYPLIPSRAVGKFLLDMQILPGCSGGPVFMMEPIRTVRGAMSPGNWDALIGLVTDWPTLSPPSPTPIPGLGNIVPATLILDTIKMLPPPSRHDLPH